jgi:hypothetical protein
MGLKVPKKDESEDKKNLVEKILSFFAFIMQFYKKKSTRKKAPPKYNGSVILRF